MSVPGPEIHHIGHPNISGLTCCGIPMPAEQSKVRERGQIELCDECVRRFRRRRNETLPPVANRDEAQL